MQTGLVSIITPIYNGGKYVSHTIDSVINQTYPNWEMIIVNDGSTDDSVKIIEEYLKKDDRITLYSQSNGGSASARNNGIRRANGQYIALLDSDDLWEPFFLESQLALMKEKNAALVYGSHKRIDEQGKECLKPFIVPESVTYNDLLKTCSISCLTGVYDISEFGKIYLNEDLKSLRDDHLYWLEILKKVKVAYGNQQVIASYRVLGGSVSRNKKKVIIPQFRIYYNFEKLGFFRSVYYLMNWAINGYAKYRR